MQNYDRIRMNWRARSERTTSPMVTQFKQRLNGRGTRVPSFSVVRKCYRNTIAVNTGGYLLHTQLGLTFEVTRGRELADVLEVVSQVKETDPGLPNE